MIVLLLEPLDSWSPAPASFTGIHREPGKMVAIKDFSTSSPEWRRPSTQICEASSPYLSDGVTGQLTPVSQESLRPEQKTPLTPEALAITAVRISIFPFFFSQLWV